MSSVEVAQSFFEEFPAYSEYKDSDIDWLGKIPKHWRVGKLRWYLSLRSGDYISNDNFVINPDEFNTVPVIGGNGIAGFTSISNINKPTIAIGRVGALCGNVHFLSGKNWITDNAIFLSDWKCFNTKFLGELLKVMNLNKQASQNAQPLITGSLIKEQVAIIPTEEEQKQIATFLDRATTEIDQIIEQQKQLITLLEEERTTVISHAVTKGLDPSVPMKDSGIEWLGEIPKHWEIWTVRNLIRNQYIEIQDGNHGELHPCSEDYVDTGIPFVMANNVRNGKVDLEGCKFISEAQAKSLRIGFSKAGDVLLTHKGTLGETAIVPESLKIPFLMLTPQVTYYRPLKKEINIYFLVYFFQSQVFREQMNLIASNQSTRDYIGIISQKNFRIILPDLLQQQAIASFLDQETARIDEAIENVRSQIEKLEEYRTVLISDAVTGKIDVRGFVS